MEVTGVVHVEADRPATCRDCGWTGSAASVGRPESGADTVDPVAEVCPHCGAIVAPDLPSVDEIRAARRAPEA
jgi:hypothetical protein